MSLRSSVKKVVTGTDLAIPDARKFLGMIVMTDGVNVLSPLIYKGDSAILANSIMAARIAATASGGFLPIFPIDIDLAPAAGVFPTAKGLFAQAGGAAGTGYVLVYYST